MATKRKCENPSEVMALHPKINMEAAVLNLNWVSSHDVRVPSGTIALTNGYIERIEPQPLRTAVGWNIAVFPIPKLGYLQGPMIDPDIICAFMQDMEELLFTRGFIMLYASNISDADAAEIVNRAFSRKKK